MPRYLFILAVISLFLSGISRGENGELDQIGVKVVQANPELIAARFMIEEAKGRQLGSGRLMNPEIEASATRMTEGQEGGFNIGLMQKFPTLRDCNWKRLSHPLRLRQRRRKSLT